jgi:hypothetical protein
MGRDARKKAPSAFARFKYWKLQIPPLERFCFLAGERLIMEV